MTQLALDLVAKVAPSLDNFVEGGNAECLRLLRAIAQGDRRHRFLYLWGSPGSGRSHLAQAMSATPEHPARLRVVDDVQQLSPDEQQALFEAFLRAAADPAQAILCTGDRPPLALSLREDLRTRLGAGLVYELRAPDDAGRAQALASAARARGLRASPDLIPWLLTHHDRDLRVLMATLEALDRFALQQRRPLTLPLLRAWLASGSEDATGAAGNIRSP